MAELFETTRNNVTLHIGNIFKEHELDKDSVCKDSLLTAADGKMYKTKFYNLDVIISVGYRVKSLRGTQFRQWANKVLKDYLLRGYSINQRFERLEQRVTETKNSHDRFLIIDNDVYHIGASIKDLGKRWFAFSKMAIPANEIIKQLNS